MAEVSEVPRHDWKCEGCGLEFEAYVSAGDSAVCPDCGSTASVVFRSAPSVHMFHEGWYEHIDTKPIYVSSKKQLKAECEKRGLIATYYE